MTKIIGTNNYVFHELPVSSPQETSIDEFKDSENCDDSVDSEYSEGTGGNAAFVGNTVVDNTVSAITEVVLLIILELDVLGIHPHEELL